MDLPLRFFPILFLLASELIGQSQPSVYFKNITIADGLSNNEVKQITQDEEGFIWFATGSGVNRYDGYTIKQFDPVLKQDYPKEQLTWRPLKMIWDYPQMYIGSDFAGLQVYDVAQDSIWSFNTENSSLPGNAIFKICKGKDDLIYLGTNNGLCIFNFQTKSFTTFSDYVGTVYAITEDLNDHIWFSDDHKGLIKFDPKTLAFQTFQDNGSWSSLSPPEKIYDLNHQEGKVYVASEHGIWSLDITKHSIKKIIGDETTPAVFSCVLRDHLGNIWAGTYNHGVFHYDRETNQITNLKHNLLDHSSVISNKISCLYQGDRGNIWIGTYGDGVSVIKPDFQKIKVLRQLDYAPLTIGLNDIKGMVRTLDGIIWLALENGVSRLDSQSDSIVFFDFRMFTHCSNNITHISADESGDLYLSTNCGIVHWSPTLPQKLDIIDPRDTLFPRSDFLSLHYEQERLYVGTTLSDASKGLWVHDLSNGKSSQYQHENGTLGSLSGNNATRVIHDAKGQTWVGTWDDLNLAVGDTFTRIENLIEDPACLPGGSTVWAIYEDHQGYIWYSRLDEGGLLVIDPRTNKYRCFNLKDQLFTNSVTAIMQDYNYDLWIGTYFGIAKIKYPADIWENVPLDIVSFTVKDGLPINTIWNGVSSKDGHSLFFGTTDGLIKILPERTLPIYREVPLRFTDFKLLNQNKNSSTDYSGWETTKTLQLPYNQNAFTVEFAGLNFLDNEYNEYMVQFGDGSSGWSDIGRRHSATFSNLNPGTYSLQVKTKGRNSPWSSIEKMEFQINPPFWKTAWFMAGTILILGFLAYKLHLYRLSRLIEIQSIRNRIAADLHDDIGTTLSNIEILSHLSEQGLDKPSKIRSYIQEIKSQSRKSNQSLHDIVWSINPENDKLEQVVIQLSRLAIELLEPKGIVILLEQDLREKGILIKSEKRKDIFLAFKESISNIARHSQTETVRLKFQNTAKVLTITIVDHGVGLKADAMDKGNGLGNIKQRMAKWHGAALFKASDTGGLEVTLIMPLPQRDHPRNG